MNELQNFKLLGIALAIGLLIGLERGWRTRDKGEGMRIAGLRTHGLVALLGGVWGILAQQSGVVLMGFAFLSLTCVLLMAYGKSLSKFEDYSITSIIATLITFTLGALTVYGHTTLASASAVIITLLLGFKPLLHGWMNKLEQHELDATLKLLLISVVLLPILPDRGFGPWMAINPYQVWWMVVLIAGISYLGYFANRIAGNQHGPVLTGIMGGLASSTAVTLNLARLSKTHPGMHNALSAGILTACATMFVRIVVLTYIINPVLSVALLPALSVMGMVTYFMAFLFWQVMKDGPDNSAVNLENPFQLAMAIKFGAFLVAILLLSKYLKIYFGDMGAYVIAAVSGLADVDPITLSLSQLSKEGLAIPVASQAILIAVSVNSGLKSMMALAIGDKALGLRVVGTLLCAVMAGLLLTLSAS